MLLCVIHRTIQIHGEKTCVCAWCVMAFGNAFPLSHRRFCCETHNFSKRPIQMESSRARLWWVMRVPLSCVYIYLCMYTSNENRPNELLLLFDTLCVCGIGAYIATRRPKSFALLLLLPVTVVVVVAFSLLLLLMLVLLFCCFDVSFVEPLSTAKIRG